MLHVAHWTATTIKTQSIQENTFSPFLTLDNKVHAPFRRTQRHPLIYKWNCRWTIHWRFNLDSWSSVNGFRHSGNGRGSRLITVRKCKQASGSVWDSKKGLTNQAVRLQNYKQFDLEETPKWNQRALKWQTYKILSKRKIRMTKKHKTTAKKCKMNVKATPRLLECSKWEVWGFRVAFI